MRLFGISSFILSCVVFSSCVVNPVTGKKEVGVWSFEKEKAMGAQYDPQIVASYGLYEDQTFQTYFNNMGKEMAAISHNPDYDYEFKIMDSPVVNAFAVPGGYVYFTRGIMAHFNNEAEFAGVLGHEIGHVTARHSAKQQRNGILAQIGVIAGAVVAPELVNFESASQGAQLMLLKFGREAETESDKLGVEYSCKIGYDAEQMALFFNTLSRKQAAAGVSIPEFLSTHPNPDNRRETVGQLAIAMKQSLNLTDAKIGRNSYLQMIDGLAYGEDPRQGFVENDKFYHPELKFMFNVPSGWGHQNSPQQFQMGPDDGSSMMFLALAQGSTLEEAASQTLQGYGFTSLESSETTYNGIPVKTVVGVQQAAEGQAADADPVKAKFSFIKYNGLIYNLAGVSHTSVFNSNLSTFDSVMKSFNQLTDPDKLNKQPERVVVKTVPNSGTFTQVMTSLGMPASRMEELSILNGILETEQVEKGSLIKIVQ